MDRERQNSCSALQPISAPTIFRLAPLRFPFRSHARAKADLREANPTMTVTENIHRLRAALSSIVDWVTSNLLCHNSAKTEFLLLGRKLQLNDF